MRHIASLSLLVALAASSLTAQSIQYVESRKIWLLTTRDSTYAMGVDPEGTLQHLYWGAPLWRADDVPAAAVRRELSSFDPPAMLQREEFPAWGGTRYYEPALKVTRADGNRDVVLRYVSHQMRESSLDITLKDIRDDIQVVLHYRVYPDHGILERSATIRNETAQPLMVESAQSATWNLPAGEGYQLTYLTGRWAAETQVNHEAIHQGMKVLESRKGHTSHNINPWFAIDAGDAGEEHGSVWFGALAWSGNWRITVEQTPYQQVRVTGGLNTFDFAYPLKPGEALDTPAFYAGYSAQGFGAASRLLHRFEREEIAPGGLSSRVRPVLYNSWEATTFNVNEAGQKVLATTAAKLGVELFVMDDGWFGQRKDDHAGLGDWYVNPEKFPHSLKPLIDKVHALGMDFGLWVEPEMVNPDSDLYRKHPDWVLSFPGRPRSEQRNQLVLNLARPDVRDYVLGFLDKLLSENDIAFLKWDYNRNWTEPGWDQLPASEQKRVYVEFTRNLYAILAELRHRHPKVEFESCSGGGGRVDLGILRYVDEVWPSDNTDPFDRLTQQDGFTYAYTPQIMMAWVTDSPHWLNKRSTSLSYRMLSSMQGSLGIGANIANWSPEEFALAKRLISEYRQVQTTIVQGDLYRLISPRNGSEFSVTQTVNPEKTQSVVFAFIHSTQQGRLFPRLKLKGLDPVAEYALSPIVGKPRTGTPPVASGAWWMNHGLDLDDGFRGDFQGAAFRLDKQ